MVGGLRRTLGLGPTLRGRVHHYLRDQLLSRGRADLQPWVIGITLCPRVRGMRKGIVRMFLKMWKKQRLWDDGVS